MANEVYALNRITDLLDIPDDRLEQCLSELSDIVRALRLAQTAARALGDQRPASQMFPNLRWQDDGDPTASVVDLNSGGVIRVLTQKEPS